MSDLAWLRFYGTNGREYAFQVSALRRIEDLGEGRLSVDGETVYADYEEVMKALPASRLFTSESDPRARDRAQRGGASVGKTG